MKNVQRKSDVHRQLNGVVNCQDDDKEVPIDPPVIEMPHYEIAAEFAVMLLQKITTTGHLLLGRCVFLETEKKSTNN